MPGIAIKQYPCCLSLQSALDAMIGLATTRDIRAGEVERIESFTHPRRLEHTNRPAPRSTLDAKLSIQYCLARGILERRVGLDHFEGEAHLDPAVRAMMARVHAQTYAEDSVGEGEDFTARLRVTLTGGRVHETSITRPVGHEPGVPLAADALDRKFAACARTVLTAEAAETVRAMVRRLESLDSLQALSALLAGRQPTDAPAC